MSSLLQTSSPQTVAMKGWQAGSERHPWPCAHSPREEGARTSRRVFCSHGIWQDLGVPAGPQAKSNMAQNSPSMCPSASRKWQGHFLQGTSLPPKGE